MFCMLIALRQLKGVPIRAIDGEIGSISDVLVDLHQGMLRYFVVETGVWLKRRKVLIPHELLDKLSWSEEVLSTIISQEQVEQSPPIDPGKAILRRNEEQLRNYFGIPIYWEGNPIGAHVLEQYLLDHVLDQGSGSSKDLSESEGQLWSVNALRLYQVQSLTDELGYVSDLIADFDTWDVRYLVIDLRKWLPWRMVYVNRGTLHKIDSSKKEVHLNASNSNIRECPRYLPSQYRNVISDLEHPQQSIDCASK